MLKQYLVEETSKPSRRESEGYATNAQALAGIIWEEAISGKSPFVQFLVDRVMVKGKDKDQFQEDNIIVSFDYGTTEEKITANEEAGKYLNREQAGQ